MLPAEPPSARQISGVAADLRGAIAGLPSALPRVRSTVLIVIDGLGMLQLRAHAGHARRLTAGMGKKDVAYSVFPSTTASALTTLLTGVEPGEHGLVGYRVLDRERDRLVNMLSGWESDKLDARVWQPVPTVFETAAEAGHPVFAVGLPVYATTGFTHATLRGATFFGQWNARDRVAQAYQLAAEHEGALVYCYLPEVDKAGHKHGVDSTEWLHALEDLDSAFAQAVPPGVGVLVTADHGMIDVPRHRHLVIDEGDRMLEGVRHCGGEPRMLHVYLEPDASVEAVRDAWRVGTEKIADVLTGDEAVAAGLFGTVLAPGVRERIGDLVIPARGIWALYDGTAEDQRAQTMVGQHGSLTPEERQVPYLRFGAFAQ